MEEITTRQAFLTLKPLCDSLMKNPNVQIAIDVENCITNLPKQAVRDLTEYILFPAIVHLQTNISKNVKLHLVNIMKITIPKTTITNFEFFNKLYLCLNFCIYDKQQSNLLIPMNEELKESVVQCLKYLMLHASMDIIEVFYTRDNAAKLSQSICTCLSIAKTEKSPSLRVAAIEALIGLTYVHDEADLTDTVLRSQIADIIMLFLPGIVKGLQDIFLGSDVQNHKITTIAIRALGRIVALVMEDLPQDDKVPSLTMLTETVTRTPDPLGILLRDEGRNGMEKHIKSAHRNQDWLYAASEKLQVPMQNLIKLTKHQHHKVRRELNFAVYLILSKCSRNMNKNFAELVEILIALSEDDSADVRKPAIEALKEMNSVVAGDHKMRPIIEILEERFYKLLTKLPRIIRMSDDATQLSYLNQLIGYLRLLGKNRLPQIMSSIAHLRRLILSLVYVAEFDCSGVVTLEDNQIRSIGDSSSISLPSWKRFKFIRDTATEQKMTLICHLLGTIGDLSILVDSIFELITELPHYQKELILLLNWVMGSTDNINLSLYEQIIDFYTAPEFWYLPIQIQDGLPLREMQSNVVLSCLLTEGIGLFALVLQDEYQKFLLKTLYLIIERAGNGNALCSLVGSIALEHIARSQKHESGADLVRANVDYFSFHVTIKLKRMEKNPGVLNVVAVVMKYSTLDLLPCLKEIVEDALIQLGANYQQANAHSLLKVLHTFVLCVRKMIGDEENEDASKPTLDKDDSKEMVVKSVLEHYEAKKTSEDIDNEHLGGSPEDILKELEERDVNEGIGDYGVPDEEEQTKKPPPHVTMTESVVKCCLNFLPSKDISIALLTMQTLQEGLHILAKWEEHLLPIVHQLWHPLIDRFHDPNILVINRAWQLLYTIAGVAEDFIRHRTLKQVSPALGKFLINTAKDSCKKNLRDDYKFTQTFKLQKLLLSQLGPVAKHLKIHERELWKLVTIAEPYLDSNQDPELQECSISLYKYIADFNSDIVWVKCLSIWNTHIEKIPSDETFNIDNLRIDDNLNNNNYRKNVCEVLKYINRIMQSIDR